MNPQYIGNHILRLDSVDSTNNYAAKLLNQTKIPFGTVIMAQYQFEGRGQRGSQWSSENAENLTFSILIDGTQLKNIPPFLLSKCVAISIKNFIGQITNEYVSLKWPNDIYVDTKKIAGILIENQWKGSNIYASIIGIGINVNQIRFNNNLNATSLKLLTNQHYNIEDLLSQFCESFNRFYGLMVDGHFKIIKEEYQSSLFFLNKKCQFLIENNLEDVFIREVDDDGLIKLEKLNGEIGVYSLNQARQVL
jgi:BirA family biotin operon repressor/biotin-[acetyl-CoA-carboxylase] ligase